MATKILKLTSVEDIIGDYEERDGKHFISNPAKLIMVPTEGGGMGIGIMPWIPFTDEDEVEIKAECIMLQPMEPSTDIRNEYSKRFGSGFVDTTPQASDIIY
jgi:hypothetical protein